MAFRTPPTKLRTTRLAPQRVALAILYANKTSHAVSRHTEIRRMWSVIAKGRA